MYNLSMTTCNDICIIFEVCHICNFNKDGIFAFGPWVRRFPYPIMPNIYVKDMFITDEMTVSRISGNIFECVMIKHSDIVVFVYVLRQNATSLNHAIVVKERTTIARPKVLYWTAMFAMLIKA